MNSLSNFGFEYEYDGSMFSFVVVAASEDEAKQRVAVMSQAEFVGVMVEDELPANSEHHSDSVSLTCDK